MSWLFGVKTKVPKDLSLGGNASTPGSSAVSTGSTCASIEQTVTESQYKFDSAALERAAQAARDLEKSSNAKEILNLTREQERTKQLEYEKQIAEYNVYQEEMRGKQAQMLAEEKRKMLAEESQHANEVCYLFKKYS